MSRQRTSRYFQKLGGIPTLMGISSSTKKAGNFDHPSSRIRIVLLGPCVSDLFIIAPALGSNRRNFHRNGITAATNATDKLDNISNLQLVPVPRVFAHMQK